MDYDMQKRAKLRCMHLLEKRDYTEKELRQKLMTGKTEYTEEQIDAAIAYVKSFHYVDDGRYACKYIEAMQSRKSRKQIEQELYQKGVAKELVGVVGAPDARTPDAFVRETALPSALLLRERR